MRSTIAACHAKGHAHAQQMHGALMRRNLEKDKDYVCKKNLPRLGWDLRGPMDSAIVAMWATESNPAVRNTPASNGSAHIDHLDTWKE